MAQKQLGANPSNDKDIATKKYVDDAVAGGGGGGGGDASTNTSTSVDSEVALFSGTAGKTLKRATGSGIAKLTSGVLSVVTAPSGTIVGTTDTQTLTSKTLDNTNVVTIKDTNLTLQDDGDVTKQAKFQLSGITAGQTRTYTLPDTSGTLALASADLTQVIKSISANNMVIDPTFSDATSWTNAFGAMDATQFWGGTQSRKLTATGGGTSVDRLWITHDGTGNQLKIPVDSDTTDSPSPMQVNLRARIQKGDSNTGSASPALRWGVYWYNSAGTETFLEINNMTEAAMATGGSWSHVDGGTQIPAAAEFFSVAIVIESAVPSGNIYWVDSVFVSDYSLLRNWLNIQNKTIGNSNTVTLKDANFTLQDDGDTSKQAKFQLSGITAGQTRTYTLPDTSSTLLTASPRINSTTSSATPAINTDTTDLFKITALAANITSMTSSLTGTPVDGQKLMIRIKDDGTARTITWGSSFQSSGVATLLSTTVISKTHHIGLIYDSTVAKWVCIAVDVAGY